MGVDLSGVLPQALDDLGWTQQRLADETGIRRTDINAIANGKEVGKDRLGRILRAIGKTEEELGLKPEAPQPRNPVLREIREIKAIISSASGERHHEHHDLAEQIARQSALLEELVVAAGRVADELAATRAGLPGSPPRREENGRTR